MATWIGASGERSCGFCREVIPKGGAVALLCGSAALARCQVCAEKAGVPFDQAAQTAVDESNLERELRETRDRLQRDAQAAAPESLMRGARPATPLKSFASMAETASSFFDPRQAQTGERD